MNKSILVSIISVFLITACSAFTSDSSPFGGDFPNVTPPFGGGGGQYEGNYVGEMTLEENTCADLVEAVGAVSELKINVIQSGDLVSVGFEDESEASGSLKDNKTTVIKKETSSTKIYHLEFSEEGVVSGDCEYIEGAPLGDQLGSHCAKYSVELSKEE